MLGPTTRPSQQLIALDDDPPLGAKRRSRASGFVHWRAAAGRFAGGKGPRAGHRLPSRPGCGAATCITQLSATPDPP